MKNIDIFKTFFHKKEIEEVEHNRREQLIDSIFAHTIYSSQKPMNTKKQFKLLFIRRHFSTSIAFALFFIAILSIFGFMQVSKEKIGTVSAKELVGKVEKAYGNRFYYKKVLTFDCHLDELNDFIQKAQANGQEVSEISLKKRDECARNNGKLSHIEKIWVDKRQNATKIEKVINPWQISEKFTHKYDLGDEYERNHMQVKEPIQMRKGENLYQFVVTTKLNSKNLMEGVFIEKTSEDIFTMAEKEDLVAGSKTGKDIFSETMEYYKNAKSSKLEVEEFQQNGKQYYKLKRYFRKGSWYDTKTQKYIQTKEWALGDEQIFEKDTYKPIKFTMFGYDEKYTKTMIEYEYTYHDFTADFSDNVFNVNQPPEGYAFAKGTVKDFEIKKDCEQCVFGDKINYIFNPQSYLNEDGNVVDYPFDMGFWNMNGKVVNFPDVKIYESKERFATEYEAQNAAQIDFQQLKNVDKSTKFLQGFQFESNITLGEEKPFSIIKVVTTNQNNEKVELNKVTKLPYKATKLPEQGKLKFQYVRTEREKEIAYYKWNEGSAMNIQVYLNGSPDDYEATMCQHEVYIRDGQGKNVCKKNRDTQIEEERALFEYDFKGEKVVVWPQSIIRSGDLTAFVRFNTAEAIDSCILENKNNSTPFSCFDKLHSVETKEEVVKEMKELLKKIEKGS